MSDILQSLDAVERHAELLIACARKMKDAALEIRKEYAENNEAGMVRKWQTNTAVRKGQGKEALTFEDFKAQYKPRPRRKAAE